MYCGRTPVLRVCQVWHWGWEMVKNPWSYISGNRRRSTKVRKCSGPTLVVSPSPHTRKPTHHKERQHGPKSKLPHLRRVITCTAQPYHTIPTAYQPHKSQIVTTPLGRTTPAQRPPTSNSKTPGGSPQRNTPTPKITGGKINTITPHTT